MAEIEQTYTCGLCEQNVEESNIGEHPCMQDYVNIRVDEDLKMYPTNDNGSLEADNGEDGLEELLIEEVSKRPILFDFRLPIAQRSRFVVMDQWDEICAILNGRLSAKEAKNKWKTLRDTFCRELADLKRPSGAAGEARKKWKHFDRMAFLKDTICSKPTITNAQNIEDEHSNIPDPAYKKHCTRQGVGVLNDTPMMKIAEAITTLATPPQPLVLPPPPQQDDVDGLFLILGNRLRALPDFQRHKLMLDIIALVHKNIDG